MDPASAAIVMKAARSASLAARRRTPVPGRTGLERHARHADVRAIDVVRPAGWSP
jgi:hypothetical protein